MTKFRQANDAIDAKVSSLIRRTQIDRGTSRMIVLLIVAFAIFAILKPNVFLGSLNLQNIGLATPEIGVLALAMMLSMFTGGIDLSVVGIADGAAIAVSLVFVVLRDAMGDAANAMWPLLIVLALLVGLLGGLINGLLIAMARITPILATLATMQIFNGLAIVVTGGRVLYDFPAPMAAIGQAAVGFVPVLFILFIVIALIVGVVANRTGLGRKLQLEGANPTASLYSGINSRRTLLTTYMMTGLLSGAAGVLIVMRNPTASADYGASYTLLVIVIAVLGGTNPNGGFGTVLGVVLASVTLQVVSSGFTALRLTSYEYSIAQGVILIVVLIIDQVDWSKVFHRARNGPAPVKTGQ